MPEPRPWRLARSLMQLFAQIDARFPKRSRASDGTVGDAAHASRSSDHNPWVDAPEGNGIGVVTAIDVTDEPASGCDGEDLAALLRASRDPRIKYIIFNGRMCRSYAKPKEGIAAWEWTAYTGENAHRKHVHISVSTDPKLFDSADRWRIEPK